MGSCYSANHFAKDHIHTGITSITEEPQQKYRLGTVSYRLLGLNHVLLDPNLALCLRYSSAQPNNYHKFNIPT